MTKNPLNEKGDLRFSEAVRRRAGYRCSTPLAIIRSDRFDLLEKLDFKPPIDSPLVSCPAAWPARVHPDRPDRTGGKSRVRPLGYRRRTGRGRATAPSIAGRSGG